MNLKDSIIGRAKRLVHREQFKQALKRNQLDPSEFAHIPLDMVEMMETIRNFKFKSNVLLDIGAFKGEFSKVAQSFFHFDQIYCFEPNAEMHHQIRANNQNSNLTIQHVALSDVTGKEVTFFMHDDASMNSTVDAEAEVLRKEFPYSNPDHIKTTRVITQTLDDFIQETRAQSMSDVYCIKLDTQGNELSILKHGIQTLKRTEICLIEFMFTSPYKTTFGFYELMDFMKANHFTCEGALSLRKRPSGKISSVDFLFVNTNLSIIP